MASPSPQSSPMPPPQAPSPMGPPQQAPSPSNPQGSPMGPPQHHPHSPTQAYQTGQSIPPGGPPMSQPPQQPPSQQQNYSSHPQQMQSSMGPQVGSSINKDYFFLYVNILKIRIYQCLANRAKTSLE